MKRQGFTFIELLTSTAVIGVLVFMLVSMTNATSKTWRNGRTKVEQFREARSAFETVTRRVGRATLNTYWDFQYAADDLKKERPPVAYTRQSELRFRSGRMSRLVPESVRYRPTHGVFFQAALGLVQNGDLDTMDRLLNSVGYFIEIGDDKEYIPKVLQSLVEPRIRSRLLEFQKPAEKLAVFQLKSGVPNDTWFSEPLGEIERPVRVVAENIVAMVIHPRLSQADELRRAKDHAKLLCPKFDYDSTRLSNDETETSSPDPEINPHNQLPPVVMVSMFAIDEISGQRLQEKWGKERTLGLDTESLFQDAAKLEDNPATDEPNDGDLAAFEKQLIDRKLNYRLFSTTIALRGAKWSRGQAR